MSKPASSTLKLAQAKARQLEWITYQHWLAWKDSRFPESRRLALKAKCCGLVTFDRVLRSPYELAEQSK